jgi:hypothetical protein
VSPSHLSRYPGLSVRRSVLVVTGSASIATSAGERFGMAKSGRAHVRGAASSTSILVSELAYVNFIEMPTLLPEKISLIVLRLHYIEQDDRQATKQQYYV